MPPLTDHLLDRAAMVAALRARIARLERPAAPAQDDAIPLAPAIDAALPWGGLARAGMHEILSADPGAAGGFCALILARAAANGRGPVLWIAPEPEAWPPGLARYGLSPADLILVRAPRPEDGLWAMEETLRCTAVAAALLALREIDLTAARRLQLAAEAGGALGLLLRPDAENPAPTAALTRWRVTAIAGTSRNAHDLGDPRWRLDLLRCRAGRPSSWTVTWRASTDSLSTEDASDPSAREQVPA